MHGIAFEWDQRKDSANRRKHGVGFAEASTVFDDPLSITVPDPAARVWHAHRLTEQLRCDQIAPGRQHGLDRLAGRIDGAIQIRSAARHFNVCLIHSPGPLRVPYLSANSRIQNGRVRRSEERRVGKECRSRWSPYLYK